jgi:hypothetical protein
MELQRKSLRHFTYNAILTFQDTIKYLGVKVDYNLNFNEHINYITGKLSQKVGYLARLRDTYSFKVE